MPRNIAEKLNRLSRAHEHYRRQTDGRAIAYSEREREFTFAKKGCRKGSRGTIKDQLLIDKMVVKSSRRRHTSLNMAWIGLKAYTTRYRSRGY